MHPDVAPDHQIHISKCQIAFNEPEQALQMSFHIFIDDLEDALRQRGADELFIGTEKENPQADAHLEAYLREKFILEVNGKPASYVFIGKEPSEDLQAIWCYLEITEVNLFQQLSVSSEVLMDVHEDQKNIIFVERAGKPSELLLLTQQRPSGSLELK
ncbi:MAG: DUF6702 family protein, partial [Bacteroidota bacterium]